MKYRSRSDIAGEILKRAQDGKMKTKLMYESYLSFAQLNEYLATLTTNGLLDYDKKTNTYKTTEKGLEFLEKNDTISNMLSLGKSKKAKDKA